MKAFIVYPTYRIVNNNAYVYLFGRLENGESFLTISHFQPYFWIKKSELEKAKKIGEKSGAAFETDKEKARNFDEEDVVKVILNLPSDVPKMRELLDAEKIECYEADVRFVYRFMIDNEIKGVTTIKGEYKKGNFVNRIYENPSFEPVSSAIHSSTSPSSTAQYEPELKVLSIDIETNMDSTNKNCTNESSSEIISISLYTENYKKVLIVYGMSEEKKKGKLKNAMCFENEKAMLEYFKEKIQELDPDIITGWNVVDFDFAVIRERFKEHKIPFVLGRAEWESSLKIQQDFFKESTADIAGRQVLDGMAMLRSSFIALEDYKLETAAQSILGRGKLIKGDNRGAEVMKLYKTDPQKVVDYNLEDAKLVYDILEKKELVRLYIHRSTLTGMQLDRVSASIASLDSMYLRETKKQGLVCPTSKYGDKGERIKGGFVRESSPGIYDYIIVLDFKSLYPSIIRTFNIDPYSFDSGAGANTSTKKSENGKKEERGEIVAPNKARFFKKTGILPSIIQYLWEMRDKAKKKKDKITSNAIKISMNSFFGSLANPVCRFFNLDMANAITSYGRYIVQETAKKVEEMDYTVIYGDSITKDRFITILENGFIKIKNIEELFIDYKNEKKTKGNKEVVILNNRRIKALTLNKETFSPEFSQINEIIRHKTNKKIYRINQKYGETICTSDHSLIVLNKEGKLQPIKPEEIGSNHLVNLISIPKLKKVNKIDLAMLLGGYSYNTKYKGRIKKSKISFNDNYIKFSWTNRKRPVLLKRVIDTKSKEFESLCRLLGAYISEGSSSTKETTSSRNGASIASCNKKWLELLKKDYYTLFLNTKSSIVDSSKGIRQLYYNTEKQSKKISYIDKTKKLQMMNNLAAVFFKMLAGQKSSGKKIPEFMYHVENRYKKILLKHMILGDGSRETKKSYSLYYRKRHFRYDTKSLGLISGLSLLLTQLGYRYSIQYRPSKQTYRIISSDKNNKRVNTKLSVEKYDGFVYDLSINGNNMFVDSCGHILLHNTDSIFVESKAKTLEDADKIGKKIQDDITEFWAKTVKEWYKMPSFLELQYEKVYRKFIMPKLRGVDVGAKKRYAGLLIIKDEKGNTTEKLEVVGMEFVRRDWTELAKVFQVELLNRIFNNKEVSEYVINFVKDLKKGKYDELLVYKKELRKGVDEYTKTTPPHVKAARLLDKIDSTIIEYVLTEKGPEPIQKLKSKIDYEHYTEKQLKPIADSILVFFNQNFDDLVSGKKQKSLFDY